MATVSTKRKASAKVSSKGMQIKTRPAKTAMGAGKENKYFSRAVAKAFHILDLLHLWGRPITLNEMATQTGLTKSSCFRLLHTLAHLRFVEQQADGRYVVAKRNWMSSSAQVAQAILQGPQDVARALNEEFRETVSISVLYTNHIEVVQTFESSRVLRMANTVGRILPPHASSMGKAITAFQTEAMCKQLLVSYGLQPITKYSITDEVVLRQELEKVRAQGYAYEGEESTPDGCCFGAPIMLDTGAGERHAVAAVSISMPKSRVPEGSEREHVVKRLREVADTIGKHLIVAMLERNLPGGSAPSRS